MITPKTPSYGTRSDTEQNLSSIRRGWFQRKFFQIYFLLALVFLVLLAVLILLAILITKLSYMSDEYKMIKTESQGILNHLGIKNDPTYSDSAPKSLPYTSDIPSKQDYDEMNGGSNPQPINPIVFGPNLTIARTPKNAARPTDSASLDSDPYRWYKEGGKCGGMDSCPSIGTRPPLLILSFDGFASRYLDRRIVKNLELLAECGTKAEYVLSSYPTKTFPNHYSIVTGQYPGYHGLVDNTVFDPDVSDKLEDMKRTSYSEFFESQPIWSVYNRETGKSVGCQMWLGCTQHIGNKPKYNIPFNRSTHPKTKVDQIISWLLMSDASRPGLLLTYFDEPDGSGHWSSEQDPYVNMSLANLDDIIGYLLNQLHDNNLLDCLNIVIVSDHGMQELKDEHRIYLDEMIDLTGVKVSSGVVGRLYMDNAKITQEDVAKKLGCNAGQKFRLYNKTSLPLIYHYAQSKRAGDMILEGQPGTTFLLTRSSRPSVVGDHGYDFRHGSMHTIFFARGPGFRRDHVVPPFQNVEYYNLFAELLGIPNVPQNNGTKGILTDALQPKISQPIPNNKDQFYTNVSSTMSCSRSRLPSIEFCGNCSEEDQKVIVNLVSGFLSGWDVNIMHHTEATTVCGIAFCDSVSITTSEHTNDRSFAVFEKLNTSTQRVTSTCQFSIGTQNGSDCSTVADNVMAGNQLSGLRLGQVEMNPFFSEHIWSGLQQLTNKYVTKYGQLYSISGALYNGSTLTHLYRILLKCAGNLWNVNQRECLTPNRGETLAFLIPHVTVDWNCMKVEDILMSYTSRIKDIELFTGFRFFNDEHSISYNDAIRRTTNIALRLWEY